MLRMTVDFYAATQGYGFCGDQNQRLFFRVEDFQRLSTEGPLPICGELASVEFVSRSEKSLRAKGLRRLVEPRLLQGQVRSFDSNKGWGFVTHDGDDYFLHRSDLTVQFTPIIGSFVKFYAGIRRGRRRACYIAPTNG